MSCSLTERDSSKLPSTFIPSVGAKDDIHIPLLLQERFSSHNPFGNPLQKKKRSKMTKPSLRLALRGVFCAQTWCAESIRLACWLPASVWGRAAAAGGAGSLERLPGQQGEFAEPSIALHTRASWDPGAALSHLHRVA